MTRTPLLLVLAVGIAVALAPAADACEPSTSDPEVDTCNIADTGVGVGGCIYVDNDLCQPECLFSVWIYCESNGEPGLQRGDEVVDDTCGGMTESDGCPG